MGRVAVLQECARRQCDNGEVRTEQEKGPVIAPRREPEEAGAIIAREAMRADFSLFEYFETDRAAHAMDREAADRCLADLSAALETVLAEADLGELLVLVASDHGNLEDIRVKTHTRNPAFFAAWGAWNGHPEPRSLIDIAPLVREALGVTGSS